MINKRLRTPDVLEAEPAGLPARVDPETISIALALAHRNLRGAVGDWRGGRPGLAAWHGGFADRPSMRATAPPG